MYRYHLNVPGAYPVELFELRDRAVILDNGMPAGTLYRNDPQPHRVMVTIPEGGADVDVLVENMGRINYGYLMNQDRKGILFMGVAGAMREMSNLKAISLPMNDISGLPFKSFKSMEEPAFYRGYFEAETVCDTFIKVPGGMKGNVWLNGFNLGRYWNVGPQLTLYAPAPLLKKGRNEIIVFELHGMRDEGVESVDKRDFGTSVPMKLP
ncbi:MAG: beta galactosidase jelly roll domain-containing protein, partial [Victivallales bacterium]|nr:beta galactosidase jelly roll domain-containing protein [Victivallales bacterium]